MMPLTQSSGRITEAERNEIDLAEALGPNALIDKEREAFKNQKEKAKAFVRADGKQIGGDEKVQGDIFTFFNKLFQHEMKRAGEPGHMMPIALFRPLSRLSLIPLTLVRR